MSVANHQALLLVGIFSEGWKFLGAKLLQIRATYGLSPQPLAAQRGHNGLVQLYLPTSGSSEGWPSWETDMAWQAEALRLAAEANELFPDMGLTAYRLAFGERGNSMTEVRLGKANESRNREG